MLRGRFNYPDLDVLDSPLLSPTPFGSGSLSSIPGSAIAERIFNDPDSWEETDGDEGDFPEDVDQLAWLTEEIEKIRAGVDSSKPPFDDSDDSPSTPTDKDAQFITTPTSGRSSLVRRGAGNWKGVSKKSDMRPISLSALFEHSNEDFSSEIQQQLSKILESGGIPHHICPFPHSSALSPPSTSGTNSTLDSPLHLQTGSLVANAGENSPSPINIYSASATLSFLEWYGIFPDSPRLDINGRRMQPKSARLRTPLLQVPSPRHAARPTSLLSPPSTAETFVHRPKRSSSVPPPGLDLPTETASPDTRPASPPGLPRSPSPMKDEDQPQVQNKSTHEPAASLPDDSERGRTLRMTAPPPYARAPSPAPPVSRSNSTSNIPSREGTPSRLGRRLPNIPPESTSRPVTPPEPLLRSQPPQLQPQCQPQSRSQSQSRTQCQPQSQPQPARSATAPAVQSSSTTQPGHQQQQGPRPVSVRSPLGGPAGPRIRSRASHDATSRSIGNVGNRPPGLRL
ncbi:hypothetical protein CVT25_014055 [Psilocybe cyanescens]|uniref:Uncharacterized protein n=1 Tax=Psilocybe cyanescens TaxID=93625 RepID=A0A409X1U2_PSICY|nr:hypothetical protein CVT25_014055 [Psilocybe cyanescens]